MLSRKIKDAIEDVLNRKAAIASMQEGIKEDVKAISGELDMKPAQLNKILSLIEKERESGEAVQEERGILDFVEEIVGPRNNEEAA